MTIAPEVETWSLTDLARGQLQACGIALSELYRLLLKPAMTVPGLNEGEVRVNGYGLTAVICDREVRTVEIDGATAVNWSDWAVERAEFGDGDVAGADDLVREHLARLTRGSHRRVPRARYIPPERIPQAFPVTTRNHILDRIHPALHAEIIRQVGKDYSRLVIHSRTKVTIQPA